MVPKKELATVKAFFDFLSITRKKTHNGKAAGRQFIRKAIDSILGYLRGSRGKVFSGLWNIAKRGFPVIWNLVAHPFIRKKYGLYKKAMDR